MSTGKKTRRNLDFLCAKYNVFLKLIALGWIPQDLGFGGPDLVVFRNNETHTLKIRYAIKGDAGCVFHAGGGLGGSFSEVSAGSEHVVFVCMDVRRRVVGCYVFPHHDVPKSRTFLHSETGPYPKYKRFYENWSAFSGSSGNRGVG